jgi:hypothetical protein
MTSTRKLSILLIFACLTSPVKAQEITAGQVLAGMNDSSSDPNLSKLFLFSAVGAIVTLGTLELKANKPTYGACLVEMLIDRKVGKVAHYQIGEMLLDSAIRRNPLQRNEPALAVLANQVAIECMNWTFNKR